MDVSTTYYTTIKALYMYKFCTYMSCGCGYQQIHHQSLLLIHHKGLECFHPDPVFLLIISISVFIF